MQFEIASALHTFKVKEYLTKKFAIVLPSDITVGDAAGALVAYRVQPGFGLELWGTLGYPCGFGFKTLTQQQRDAASAAIDQEQATWNAPQLSLCASLEALRTSLLSPKKPAIRRKRYQTVLYPS